MCFSAQASFTASVALLAISALCFKKTRSHAQQLLAGCPFFFGVQQALEGVVWLTVDTPTLWPMLHAIGIYGFLFFAYMFWPVYVPLTMYTLEKNSARKNIIRLLLLVGSGISLAGFIALTVFGFNANATHHHIVYEYIPNTAFPVESSHNLIQNILLALYVMVVSGSLLLSSTPYMKVMGMLVTVAFIVAQIAYAVAFGSVWCFFAALISVVIYLSLRALERQQ